MTTESTTTTHTPGQWHVQEDSRGRVHIISDGTHIAEVMYSTTVEALDAHARLIAAAPDLLDALKRLFATVRPVQTSSQSDTDYQSALRGYYSAIIEAEDQARAAIAQATGEAQ